MQTLEELARSGMSKAAAARLLGINENKLRRMLPPGTKWKYSGSGRNTDLSHARAARSAKRRLTDELLREFVRRKQAGEKWIALCAEYGFNESYIRKAMAQRGITLAPSIEQLAKLGISKAEAARRLGLSVDQLRRRLPEGVVWVGKKGQTTDTSKARAAALATRRLTDEVLQVIVAKRHAGVKWSVIELEHNFTEKYMRRAIAQRVVR